MSVGQRSLNYREINLLLAETDIVGARVQSIHQPRPEELILVLYHGGRRRPLLFCMSRRACRFHFYSGPIEKGAVRQRFVSFLVARARDAVVRRIEHVAEERILKITLERGGRRSFLWVRLWSSAPNIIFTDETGTIGDALFRRPKKGEISGGHYDPEEEFRRSPPQPKDPERFPVRDFAARCAGSRSKPVETRFARCMSPSVAAGAAARDGGDPGLSLHERVEAYFREAEATLVETDVRERLLNRLAVEESRLLASTAASEKWLSENADVERLRQFGDLIMSALADIPPGAEWFHGRDFFNGDAPIEIRLDQTLSPVENAERYYRQYKKTKAMRERAEEERATLERKLEAVRARIAEASAADAARIEELAAKAFAPKARPAEKEVPGLVFQSEGFVIYVGRTAKENEELFRRHVRGNDYWLHARDYPGASVFVKIRKAKSVPLEVLLDAGNLALFYSKAKNSARADLYYTQVKYLKKAGGAKPGLFLPSHEKNLAVRLEPERIARLKQEAETFD
jgi:predicted ribosome quality control (RQC) complex YloA/Tae2 family protein